MQETSDLVNRSGESCTLGAPAPNQNKIKLALFSSGLGTINRGFEISTARIFRSIQNRSGLDARLFAGADYPDAKRVWCVGRNTWLRFPLNLLAFLKQERLWRLAYALEQTSFCFGLLPNSGDVWQPEVVWTKEVPLAHVLYEFRRLSGNPYKIIFANGGGFRPQTYQQFDYIQHLHPEAYEEALSFGISASKMNVIPNVVPYATPLKSREELRAEFGYSNSDWIIICVAAWNRYHKRLDYLIEEVAKANIPDCKLLICGQPEPDGDGLQQLAEQKLGSRARFITVGQEKVHELLQMSDLFVLCSLYEGLGAVMIEAAMAGLPVISHPHGGSRYILQDERWLVDMSSPGNLAKQLRELRQKPVSAKVLGELKEKVQSRFNENKIASAFEAMVKQVHESSK